METNTWQLQDAKSKFSRLVENAMGDEPQFVTKYGNNAVVILSYEAYKEMIKPEKDLISFLRDSPLAEIDLEISRDKALPREVVL